MAIMAVIGKNDKKGNAPTSKADNTAKRFRDVFDGIAAVPATDLRKDAPAILGRVEYGGEDIILTRHGKPAAALVSLAVLKAFRDHENAIDAADADAALRDIAKHGTIPWAEVKRRNGL